MNVKGARGEGGGFLHTTMRTGTGVRLQNHLDDTRWEGGGRWCGEGNGSGFMQLKKRGGKGLRLKKVAPFL